jgi:hypothetical protein
MADDHWIKTLADGRKAKFIYQELAEGGAFMTAQIAGIRFSRAAQGGKSAES